MRCSKILVDLFLVCGLGLLGVMAWQVGPAALLESFRAVGFWIAPYLLLRTIPTLLHTAAWMACFPQPQRHLGLWKCWLVQLAGSASNAVVPTATIGGEIVKVMLLKPSMPREQAMASVVIDKASGTIAKMAYLAVGMVYLMQHLPLPIELQLSVSLSIGLISLGLVGFVAAQRSGGLGKLVQRSGVLRLGQARLQGVAQHLVALDAHLVAYYTGRPWRFGRSLLLHVIAHVSGIFKTYVLLHLLLGVDAPGISETIMIVVAIAALDQTFFFVPGRLGTLEWARFLVLSMLGITQIYALAFVLISRVEQLVWSGLGLLAYGLYPRYISPSTPTAGVKASPSA